MLTRLTVFPIPKRWILLILILSVTLLPALYRTLDPENLPDEPSTGIISIEEKQVDFRITDCSNKSFGIKLYGNRSSLTRDKKLPCTWPNILAAVVEMLGAFLKTPARWVAPSLVSAVVVFFHSVLIPALQKKAKKQ